MDRSVESKLKHRKNRQKQKNRNMIKLIIFLFLLVIFIVMLINSFLFTVVTVDGDSMQRTLFDGDRLLVKKIGINKDDINIDDLIYFKGNDKKYYLKRVVALPGDVVEIVNSRLIINGVEKTEDYTRGDATQAYDKNKWILKDDEFFVLGDNRYKNTSVDSRAFGPVKIETIEGKVIRKLKR